MSGCGQAGLIMAEGPAGVGAGRSRGSGRWPPSGEVAPNALGYTVLAPLFDVAPRPSAPLLGPLPPFAAMQEVVILECTEARKEGKPPSRYLTTRNKKTVTERIEKKKYNPFLRRHTLHKEIK